MSQLSLALARRTDPVTSHAAAAVVDARTLEALIVDTLRRHGPRTTAELADLTGASLVSVSPRMKPLAERGIVVADGKRKNPSGVRAIAWRLA